MLEDYAFFISGLLDLFDASQRVEWLDAAIELQTLLERHFAAPAGGFYATPDDAESLLVREKPTYDGAQPSGNSVAVLNLLRLAELTEDERYRDRGERALESLGGALDRGASGSPKLVTALDFLLDKPKQVVIVTSESVIAEPLLAEVRKVFSPNRVLVVVSETQIDRVKERLPLVAAKKMNGGLPTAYVCTAGACDRPTTDPAELAAQLKTVAPLGREVAPLARR